MPKSTATVIYTLTLINGDLAVPSGSKFMLNMANTISYTGLGCNGGGAIIPGTAVTYAAALAVRGVITCTFNVPVTAAHVTAGKIPEFTVSAQWTNNAGVALDDAYTIPQLTVASVPVVTGQPTLLPVKYTVAGSSLVSGKKCLRGQRCNWKPSAAGLGYMADIRNAAQHCHCKTPAFTM